MNYLSLTLSLILITTIAASAQTEKGRGLMGLQVGTLSYQNTYQTPNGTKSFSATLAPSAGYFVTDGLVIGTGIPLSLNTTKFNYVDFYNLRQITTGTGLSPFVQYYAGHAKLKPFVGFAYSYSKTISKYKTDTAGGSESKAKGYTSAFGPTLGLAYFVNRTLALSLNATYTINHQELNTVQTSPYTPGASYQNSDDQTLSLGIGFQLFFGK